MLTEPPCSPSYGQIRVGSDYVVIEGVTGAWSVMNSLSLNVLEGLEGATPAEISTKFSIPEAKLDQFMSELSQLRLLPPNKLPESHKHNRSPDFSLVVLKLTNRCNLGCTYCYSEGIDIGRGALPIVMAKTVVKSALRLAPHGLTVVLHGGEPLLEFDLLKEIVKFGEAQAAMLGKPILFTLQTNGTGLTDRVIEFIKQHHIGLGVSLDGLAEHNDASRILHSGRGTHDLVLRGVRRLQAHGMPLHVITVVTSRNAGQLAAITKYFQNELAARSVKFSLFFSQGRGALVKELEPDPQDILHSFRAIADDVVVGAIDRIEVEDLVFQIDNIVSSVSMSMCHQSPCGAGREMFSVLTSGAIHPCDALASDDFQLGNMSGENTVPFEELLTRGHITDDLSRRTVDSIIPCSDCHVRRMCGGTMTCRAYYRNNTIHSIDPVECFVKHNFIPYLMHLLVTQPSLVDYYRQFRLSTSLRPVNLR